MVIYLVPNSGTDGSGGDDATVFATVHRPGLLGRLGFGSEVVKTDAVQQLAARQLQQQHMQLQDLPPQYLSMMMSRAGMSLVQNAVLKQEADRLNLQVSDADLVRELQTGQFAQYLFPNGKYVGDEAYINILFQFFGGRLNRTDFESEIKKEMELQRLEALITGPVTVSDSAVRDAYLAQGTKVKLDFATISAADLGKTINPSDSELEAFFNSSRARYANAVPEARKIAYVAIDASNLPGGRPQISDAEVQAFYNQHKDQFQVKDQVKVRHILISVPRGADAKTDAAAKAKAEDVLKQLKGGANFADLAKKYSDDPGSKDKGGVYGPFDRDAAYVPEFKSQAFSLSAGQLSNVFKTEFGYHIMQVMERTQAGVRPLNEVKDQILPLLEQQKVGGALQALATQIAADAKKNVLDKAAAAHGLKAVTTDFLPRTGMVLGLSESAELMTQAFSTAKGAAPAEVAAGDGYAVFQVVDVQAAHAPAFADFKTRILDDYRQQRTPQLLMTQLNKLAERAKVLNDLRKAAAEMKIPVKTSELVDKSGQVPDLGSMSSLPAAFTMNKGEISGPTNLGRLGTVFTVVDKQQPSADEIAKNFDQTREQLLNAQRQEIFGVYVSNVMDRYQKSNAIRLSKRAGPENIPPGR